MTAPLRSMDKPAIEGAPIAVDRWTHILGGHLERHPRLWAGLGSWETRLLNDRIADVVIDRPIYIAGLARSGSTVLLELLARHRDAATHRYRDFPLVLTPWAWNWFIDRAGNKDQTPAERAHKDRILVTPESPEAFEEVVWMAFFDKLHDPSASAVLDAKTSNPRFESFYRDHIRKLLLLRDGTRYLAKGNYNVTRLGYLARLFADARFVVPVRDPLWHIASLMKQHKLFVSAEARDRRVLDHMRRSGHFEFGLDRRAIHVGNGEANDAQTLWRAGEEVAGWAVHWANVYGHLAHTLEESGLASSTLVVRYEDLCAEPAATLSAVLDHCELEDDGLAETAREQISPPAYYEPSFTMAERDVIRDCTAAVAERFGY
jgi:hypothetical protein